MIGVVHDTNGIIRVVNRAFDGHDLTESQLGAALSFHYNTGAIKRASWVRLFMQGRTADARLAFMEWNKPKEIIPRRRAERDLFFDGVWTGDGIATVWPVRKPSYSPDWRRPQRVDIRPAVREALAQ